MNEKSIRYGRIVEEILTDLAAVPYLEPGVQDRTFFDERNQRYAVISEGWDDIKRVNNIIADLEIINGKVWIQADNTDIAIARKLEARGIPKSDIVLGFRPPYIRAETEYAAA